MAGEIKAAEHPEAKREEKILEYQNHFSNPYIAASRGFVDAVIAPHETRPRIIDALNMLSTKIEARPEKNMAIYQFSLHTGRQIF